MMRAITPDLKSTWVGTSHWHLTSRNFCPAAKNRVAERAGAGKWQRRAQLGTDGLSSWP